MDIVKMKEIISRSDKLSKKIRETEMEVDCANIGNNTVALWVNGAGDHKVSLGSKTVFESHSFILAYEEFLKYSGQEE